MRSLVQELLHISASYTRFLNPKPVDLGRRIWQSLKQAQEALRQLCILRLV